MHFGIDVREACRALRTGKGQWTMGFVHELLARDIPLTLFSDASLPDAWTPLLQRGDTARKRTVILPKKGMSWHWNIARFVKADPEIDAYVSPVSYVVPSLLRNAVPTIPVVHDLIAFHKEPHNLKAQAIERLTLGRAVRAAVHICTASQATKVDLLARYPSLQPERVTPIFAGPGGEAAQRIIPDGKAILCIGTLCPRKNQKRLIEAFASLPSPLHERSRLILVGGRGWKDRDIVALAERTSSVEWRAYLPDAECSKLLSQATVFALPSLYEGFGMAVLDAMRACVPVLTSDRGSLREVAGDAAVFVDPEDVSSIRDGLVQLLSDDKLRRDLAQRGKERSHNFSWSRTVDLFLEALGTIDKRKRKNDAYLP